jgi:hypothetical protein
MTDLTLTLRDAARRLARAKNPKARGTQAAELLGVLRSGELQAGFYILSGTIWVDAPVTYWEAIDSAKFRGRVWISRPMVLPQRQQRLER